MIFCVETEKNIVIKKRFETISKLLKESPGSHIFPNSDVHYFDGKFWAIELNPFVPDFSWIFVVFFLIGIIFEIQALINIGIVLFIIVWFVWSKYFVYLVMYYTNKKKGYFGKFKIMSSNDSLKRMLCFYNGRD